MSEEFFKSRTGQLRLLQLERELSVANDRIKRLEDALELGVGPKRAKELLDGNKDCTAMADEALAKEAKP